MASGALVIVAGLILATLPMLGDRRFLGLPVLKQDKAVWLRVLEFMLAYALWVALGRWLESQSGPIAHQGWQFFVVTFLLFVTAAFPAFAWRYLWRRA